MKILTLSRSTSVINIPNSEHIHASDKYILSFISVRSFAEQERVNCHFVKKEHSLNHKSIEYQTIFENQKFVFSELLWPYTMILVAANGNGSWVCDPSLESYALQQPEMLRSPDYRHECDE